MNQHNTVIIGASAAGLACAARLGKTNIDYKILEREEQVASAWRNHYDRLHLHTPKGSSNLPFKKFPPSYPKYPSRDQVVAYLEDYANEMNIDPLFNTEVKKALRESGKWSLETDNGEFIADNLIVCTGNTNLPQIPDKPGLSTFQGEILHSSDYKNGKVFQGKNVLVVGFGNSACEIAICLHEHGAKPALSVRSEVNVLPRDIAGISVLQLGIVQASLSPRIADAMNKPLINLLVGNIENYGLRKLPYGPIEQIVKHHQVPLLDIGTMKLIKKGDVKVHGDVTKVDGSSVSFENGHQEQFDAIIFATGYETGLSKFLPISKERESDSKLAIKKRKHFGTDNLYLCGFYVAPTGMLRELGIESKIIADNILSKV